MKTIFHLIILIILLISVSLFSQEEAQQSEIDSSVPELFEFHEVIYPIWHTAYPAKNYEMLKEMVVDVNSGAEKIYTAQLPGILRDKQEEWDNGLAKLRNSVEKYNKAMVGAEEAEMLLAAEELHSDYEMLVRIIRPVTKEVDEFHKVLYMIYHHYWPNEDMKEFNKAVDDLTMCAVELDNCVLPKWAADKAEVFKSQTKLIYVSTKELQDLKNSDSGSHADIDRAIENVHNNYMALEALFD